jgi:multidrug resistance efflux pump
MADWSDSELVSAAEFAQSFLTSHRELRAIRAEVERDPYDTHKLQGVVNEGRDDAKEREQVRQMRTELREAKRELKRRGLTK